MSVGSRLAWLDASADEQRRVREIVQLFSQRDTQDELGGRRIVVALSDALFPGTSVLHSRARYLLFIPWLAQVAATKKDQLGWFDWLERQLIARFLEDDTVPEVDRTVGLIGNRAGPQVKQLPSAAYWTALEAWGIQTIPGTVAETLDRMRIRPARHTAEEVDELAERHVGVWHPGVGGIPDGFPLDTIDGGFRLKPDEATWLRERWLATAGGSLLAHLVIEGEQLSTARAPWEEPACLSANTLILGVLAEAERFSLALEGARGLYQLLLVEAYRAGGYDRIDADPDGTRDELERWAEAVHVRSALFEGWDRADFWAWVVQRNTRIDPVSRRFFDVWFDRMQHGDVDSVADDKALRAAVADRERFLKRNQARLSNPKLLASWQGGSPGRVVFRWNQVSLMVSDVIEGLDGARA